MKAIQQEYKTGILSLVNIPTPALKSTEILVKNDSSVVSVGTEKTMIDLAKKSLLGKARARPDLVKRVLNSIKTEGVTETYRQVVARLENPILLGYSSSGTVQETGTDVTQFKVGDRVACTGSGFASHAEFISVPEHLCALLPESVTHSSGAFSAIGGISLESVKLANTTTGDIVGVIGTGLIGLITIQLLSAYGCTVIALDIDKHKLELALELVPSIITTNNYDEFERLVHGKTSGKGLDSAIITASTNSNQPIEICAKTIKVRGTIVSTGLTGLNIPRQLFYEKELRFVVSKAWGDDKFSSEKLPGTWSAQENITEFLSFVSAKEVNVEKLITGKYEIDEALIAYKQILTPYNSHIGLLLTYNQDNNTSQYVDKHIYSGNKLERKISHKKIKTAIIGAGLYANGTFLPALKKTKSFNLHAICTPNGVRLKHIKTKYNFTYGSTDVKDIIADPELELAIILTRHDSHARMVNTFLRHGKNVFVEKPLALNHDELKEINQSLNLAPDENKPKLIVGFNRRFSKFSRWAKSQIPPNMPVTLNIVINAGNFNQESWADQTNQGGRIVGEACHFIDLIQFFTDSIVESVYAYNTVQNGFDYVISLKMASGAIANISYLTSGNSRHRREYIEIYCSSKVICIDNFKKGVCYTNQSITKIKNWLSSDRGHKNELHYLAKLVNHKVLPEVTITDYINTTLTTFAIEAALSTGEVQKIADWEHDSL